ncbi:MAG: glycosyltransferase family 39 protein [Thermomicrobiales bacterium]
MSPTIRAASSRWISRRSAWIQAAFAKVLGFHGWSILLPQALAGVASVALLYYLVRRAPGGRSRDVSRRWPAGPHPDQRRHQSQQHHR